MIQISAGGVTGGFYSASARDLRIVEASAQEPALTRLLANVRPDDVFYDIGAHHGLYAVLLAQKVKCVIAFEPERECYARLQQNVDLNGLSNLTSFCKAIGNRDAAETLYLGDGMGAINSGKLRSDWIHGAKQPIQVVCGDAFCKSESLPPPTILKIDVEGYEGSVLEGFRQSLGRPECRLVCCEIHPDLLPRDVTKDVLVQMLKRLGFANVVVSAHRTEYRAFAYKEAAIPASKYFCPEMAGEGQIDHLG